MRCGYVESRFGESYEEAICIDGYLCDLVSNEPEGPVYSRGSIGCPRCNTKEFLKFYDFHPSGNSKQRRIAIREKVRKVQSWANPTWRKA